MMPLRNSALSYWFFCSLPKFLFSSQIITPTADSISYLGWYERAGDLADELLSCDRCLIRILRVGATCHAHLAAVAGVPWFPGRHFR